MAYGLKYQTQFDSQTDEFIPSKRYTLQFLYKDYTGATQPVVGGDVTVIQRCTVDDPVAPIKGQSLDIQLINFGNVPITAFQSEDDDGVQVKLLGNSNEVLYIGFLVQDDFYETMVDFAHTITLSANDSLGLLKGVVLSEAAVRRVFTATFRTLGLDVDNIYIYTTDTAFYPQVGNTIEVLGITYTIAASQQVGILLGSVTYNWLIRVTPDTAGISETTDSIYLTGEINLINRNSLLSIIAVCLAQTNLTLITNIFLNLFEYRQNPLVSTFDQTLINSQLFISGETYEDCYSVLTKIMTAFNCTLFQANGQWNIIHWHELTPTLLWSYSNNQIPGFIYDETWAPIGNTVLDNNFFVGPTPQLSRPIAGLTKGALRGYKFSRKKFDYKTPKYLLRNNDLLTLGALIRTYTSGLYQISEYVAVDWEDAFGSPSVERFIRVEVLISTDTEAARYLVLRGATFDSIRCVPSKPIDCHIGDKIKFSCSFRTNISNVPGAVSFAIYLTDGTNNYYLNELAGYPPEWLTTFGFTYTYPAGGNSNEWNSMDTEISAGMPVSGLMNIFLPQFTPPPQGAGRESHFKDLRFEYIPYVNDTTKVIGQIHKQEQDVNKKLNQDTEITIDDSPRNSISGTLFLTTITGLLQDRTIKWRYPPDGNVFRLGQVTTYDELRWRQQTRSKFEGGFIGNYQTTVISLLAMVITDFDTTKNYTFGLLTIDYKRNKFSGTLWELYDTEQPELVNTYTFTYIYSAE